MEQEWREKLIDKIAATNDDLIEKYLEGGADALSPEDIQRGLRAGISNGSIVPVFCGAADQAHGTAQLLDGILDSIPSAARKTAPATDLLSGKTIDLKPAVSEPLSTLVFKTLVDPYGKISFVRVFSGELHANSTVFNPRTNKDERIGQLYIIKGKEQTAVTAIGPGDIGAATKLGDVSGAAPETWMAAPFDARESKAEARQRRSAWLAAGDFPRAALKLTGCTSPKKCANMARSMPVAAPSCSTPT